MWLLFQLIFDLCWKWQYGLMKNTLGCILAEGSWPYAGPTLCCWLGIVNLLVFRNCHSASSAMIWLWNKAEFLISWNLCPWPLISARPYCSKMFCTCRYIHICMFMRLEIVAVKIFSCCSKVLCCPVVIFSTVLGPNSLSSVCLHLEIDSN